MSQTLLSTDVIHPDLGKLHIATTLDKFMSNVYMIPVEKGSIFNKLKPGILQGFGILFPANSSAGIYSACFIVKLYMNKDNISAKKNKGKPVCFVVDVDTLCTWVQQEKK